MADDDPGDGVSVSLRFGRDHIELFITNHGDDSLDLSLVVDGVQQAVQLASEQRFQIALPAETTSIEVRTRKGRVLFTWQQTSTLPPAPPSEPPDGTRPPPSRGVAFPSNRRLEPPLPIDRVQTVSHDPQSGQWQFQDHQFFFGDAGDWGLFCDWDGDGVDTVGVFRPSDGFVHLRNSNDQGPADYSFYYGISGDLPLCGDWDGDGLDTIGVYRSGFFFLRNQNSQGQADLRLALDLAGGIPFAGDWDGDGFDTVALHDPRLGLVRLGANPGETSTLPVHLGQPDDIALVSNGVGNAPDSLWLHRPQAGELFIIDAFDLRVDRTYRLPVNGWILVGGLITA